MTHNVSRRTLAKGAAWAAPAVVATAAVPAYAASPNCPSDIDTQMDTYFQTYASALPDLSAGTWRFWWTETANGNGYGGTLAYLAAQYEGPSFDLATNPYVFEFAQKNVDTSPAVNRVVGGENVGSTSGGINLPTTWPASGVVNNNGSTGGSDPRNVGDCSAPNQRDMNYSSSFIRWYSADGLYKDEGVAIGEENMTCQGDALVATMAFQPDTAYYNNLIMSGNPQNLVSIYVRDGLYSGGRIYITNGIRPIGFRPPKFEDVAASTQFSGVDATCLQTAYLKRVALWEDSGEGLKGLKVYFTSWGDTDAVGTIQNTLYSGTDFKWANEMGTFYNGNIPETRGSAFGVGGTYSTAESLFKSILRSSVISEIRYRDGIH